ncbi:unnamed protein product, partial [Pleuronectes platessa]
MSGFRPLKGAQQALISLTLFKALPFVPFSVGTPCRQETLLEPLQTTASFNLLFPFLARRLGRRARS